MSVKSIDPFVDILEDGTEVRGRMMFDRTTVFLRPKTRLNLWTLNVDNYAPEITKITYPLLQHYARKIGAEFRVISERKFPGWPPVYEKLQIHELGRGAEWNLYIDSDTLVHPDFFDVTHHISKATVVHNGRDMAGNRWRYDAYFQRDGRHIGSCNWFALASEWCLDLWTPLDISFEEAVGNISPTVGERNGLISPEHLIDDYTLSRNIARYGLAFTTVTEICQKLGMQPGFLWHKYNMPEAQKVSEMKVVLKSWGLE